MQRAGPAEMVDFDGNGPASPRFRTADNMKTGDHVRDEQKSRLKKRSLRFTNTCLLPNFGPIIRADDNPYSDRRFRQSTQFPDGTSGAGSRARGSRERARRQALARSPTQDALRSGPGQRGHLGQEASPQRTETALSG